jgi:uncharacterized membrane-anchored protein YhcB (DUF1043 family)
MKKALLSGLVFIFTISGLAQSTTKISDLSDYGVKIEPDRRLMVVMMALEAAGLETTLTEKGTQFRQKLKADLQGLNPDLQQKMKFFIDQYKKRHQSYSESELVAPFISMAYALGPVPDLAEPARASDLPGELLEVLDFSPLVRQFYRSVLRNGDQTFTVAQKVDEYYKEYQAIGDAMRSSAIQMVRELTDYLNTRPQLIYAEKVKVETQEATKNRTA